MRFQAIAALSVLAIAGCGEGSGDRAPASVERSLPIDLYLANLCPRTATPARLVKRLERQAEVLLRELRVHPDWLVEYTFHDAHGDADTRLITIRTLAQEHLDSIESHPGPCRPGLRRRLERGLDES